MRRLRNPYSIYRRMLFLHFLLGLYCSGNGQLVNQTSFYIPDELNVFVDGSLVNTGFIQNKGGITVSGDWKNTMVYQGDGKIILGGNNDQHIFNNKQAIQHLITQGNGNKFIADKIVISQQLDLLKGIVFVADEDTLFLQDKAIVTVGSLSSYVDGALTAEGVGYKFFPIGKNGKYRPVEYTNIKGIKPVIEVEMFENLPPVNAPHATLLNDIYWTQKNIQGSFMGSEISFGYNFSDNIIKENVVVVEGDSLDRTFNVIENVTVQDGSQFDKITSEQELTGHIFALGTSDLGYGHNIPPRAFYLSTSLSSHATNPDNRTIKIFGDNLVADNFHFEVYNRLSESVYASNSLEEMSATGWDGRHKSTGVELPSGAYPYLLKAFDKNGNSVVKQGLISIIN